MPRTRLATSEPRPSPLGAKHTAMLTVSGQSVGTDLFPLTLSCPCVSFLLVPFISKHKSRPQPRYNECFS